MRIERDGRKEQYTYADLGELATGSQASSPVKALKPGERVMLVSNNSPEWE